MSYDGIFPSSFPLLYAKKRPRLFDAIKSGRLSGDAFKSLRAKHHTSQSGLRAIVLPDCLTQLKPTLDLTLRSSFVYGTQWCIHMSTLLVV